MEKKEINDEQDQAIYDTINKSHCALGQMYYEKELLEKKQKEEIAKLQKAIEEKQKNIKKLCEGRIKTYLNKNNKLILDLR
jgi:predicted DNA-binding protein YlxM (UPF0122 family)